MASVLTLDRTQHNGSQSVGGPRTEPQSLRSHRDRLRAVAQASANTHRQRRVAISRDARGLLRSVSLGAGSQDGGGEGGGGGGVEAGPSPPQPRPLLLLSATPRPTSARLGRGGEKERNGAGAATRGRPGAPEAAHLGGQNGRIRDGRTPPLLCVRREGDIIFFTWRAIL